MFNSFKKTFNRFLIFRKLLTRITIADNPILQWWAEQEFREDLGHLLRKIPLPLNYPVSDEEVYQAFQGIEWISNKWVDPEGLRDGILIGKKFKNMSVLEKIMMVVALSIPVILLIIVPSVSTFISFKTILAICVAFPFVLILFIPVMYFSRLLSYKTDRDSVGSASGCVFPVLFFLFILVGRATGTLLSDFWLGIYANLSFGLLAILIIPSWLIGFVLFVISTDFYHRGLTMAIHRMRQNT